MREAKAGFTLVEALVALSLIVAFAAVFDPLLFHARHILFAANGQIRAQTLLRALLAPPVDRTDTDIDEREGDTDGMRWHVSIEPFQPDDMSFEPEPDDSAEHPTQNWTLYRVTAHVFWGNGQAMMGQSLRLGAPANANP